MFDFSFGELLVVALVALVVLGPERLPKAARFTGLWVRRARAQWYSVKSELEHELASDEFRRSLHDGRDVMRDAEEQLRDLRRDLDQVGDVDHRADGHDAHHRVEEHRDAHHREERRDDDPRDEDRRDHVDPERTPIVTPGTLRD